MINNNFQNISNQEEESLNIKNEISYYLFFWPWFLLTIIMALLGSYTYLRYTPNIYKSFAQIQITKSDASSSFLTTEVTSLFGNRINIDNDISVITSQHILEKVVNRLDLKTSITQIGRVKSSFVNINELPFEISFKDSNKIQSWNLSFKDNEVLISNGIEKYDLTSKNNFENNYFHYYLNDSISYKNAEFLINIKSLNSATANIKKRIKAEPSATRSNIIDLSIFFLIEIRYE